MFAFFCPPVERSAAELQWLLTMVQNDSVHYVRSADVYSHIQHTHFVHYMSFLLKVRVL